MCSQHFLKWQHLFFPDSLWYTCHWCTVQPHSFGWAKEWMCIPGATGLVTGYMTCCLTQSIFSCELFRHIFSWKIQHTQFSCLYSSIISIKMFNSYLMEHLIWSWLYIFFHKPNKGNSSLLEVKSPSLMIELLKKFKISYCLDK